MDDFSRFKVTFFEECVEQLSELESNLARLDAGESDSETLNAIFRAVHSIKAGAGAFKFTALVTFAHCFETVLDHLRDARLAPSPEVTSLLLRAGDVLADLVDAAKTETPLPADYGRDTAQELEALITGEDKPRAAEPAAPRPAAAAAAPAGPRTAREGATKIRFVPGAALYRHANEPLLLVRELKTLGRLTTRIDLSRLPSLDALDPEEAYFAWDFELETSAGRNAVMDVFEFVVDDCELTIDEPASAVTAVAVPAPASGATPAAAAPEPPARGAPAPAKPKAATGGRPEVRPDAASAARTTSIRVDLDRVDRLVDTVGELVITQSMVAQRMSDIAEASHPMIAQGLEALGMYMRELQESVMAIRMQPVKSVFARMPRIVRDVSAKLGKQVRLVTNGENTEVDKTVIEEIADPLTHMIRNSMDHGIETPAERLAAGKPAEGTIHLSASHRGGRIVIAVEDDGRGINRDKVLRLAKERGLVAPTAQLSDEEIDNLIFAAGFSTADAVTDISGRGVGMDVVRRNIQALGGRVTIQSTPGKGSRFTLTLPLTLAVLDGMVLSVGSERYILPINSIVESLRPRPQDLHHLPNGENVVSIRGDYVRLVHLGSIFGVDDAITDPASGLVVLVDTEDRGRIGLVIDELLGQQQVVIKSLEENYDQIEGISAATILGNGRVALILDVDGLARMRPLAGNPVLASGGAVREQAAA
ncbi:MAG: chemotaxis protein CheA [Alphaproteobacteria bacterium]|nr:chemotaxis protein CheA [Alphaproteobacteria bacterium]